MKGKCSGVLGSATEKASVTAIADEAMTAVIGMCFIFHKELYCVDALVILC